MATQTEEQSSPTGEGAEGLEAVMQVIATCQTTLMAQIDRLQTNMGFILKDLDFSG